MNLIDNLIKYTEYAKGNNCEACSLEYSEISISDLDLSKYDLNNSLFLGVCFTLCDFSDVYLSGSNFGGSVLKKCILKNNIIRKALWDDMLFEESTISSMSAFRTTFMFGKFKNVSFEDCNISKCTFSDSELNNVYFRDSHLVDTDFTNCKLENVHFERCKLENVKFDDDIDNGKIFFS